MNKLFSELWQAPDTLEPKEKTFLQQEYCVINESLVEVLGIQGYWPKLKGIQDIL